MLQEETGIKDDTLQLHTAYTSYDYRSGWNSAWGLMKDMELVINQGGVYLFSTTQPDSWKQELANLESRGIGERTGEGFGQVEICSPFHLVFREEAK
jgi:CRISPR-associated protein Csx10